MDAFSRAADGEVSVRGGGDDPRNIWIMKVTERRVWNDTPYDSPPPNCDTGREKEAVGFSKVNEGPHVRGCSGHRTTPEALGRSAQSTLRRKRSPTPLSNPTPAPAAVGFMGRIGMATRRVAEKCGVCSSGCGGIA